MSAVSVKLRVRPSGTGRRSLHRRRGLMHAACLPSPRCSRLRCHLLSSPRIPDRVALDKLVQVLVYGAGHARIADRTCSATTIRERRDEWIEAGIFDRLEHIALEAYDRLVGLDPGDTTDDGCIVKAPCGGEAAGRSPVDEANKAPNAPCWSR